jgi:hypothetical protein
MSQGIFCAVAHSTLPKAKSRRALNMAGRRPKISDMPPLKGNTAVDASAYEEDIQMKVSA